MTKVNVYVQDADSSIRQGVKPNFTGTIVHFSQALTGNQTIRDMAIVARDDNGVLVTVAVDRCQVVKANVIKKT